ncbi:MAG: SpoIIE family protein phosphatase [Clostridia bacterium]|nr:SpoIIE family protein phosphatase [Clostridia bacterium]
MEQTKEIYDIARVDSSRQKREATFINWYTYGIKTVGFFLARAIPVIGFAPFGISFLAMERRFTKKSVFAALAVALGYLSLWDISFAAKYIFAVGGYMLFLFLTGKGQFDVSPLSAVCVSGIVVAVCRMGEMILTEFSVGGVIQLLLDVAMTTVGAVVFERSRGIFTGNRNKLFSMNREEKLCVGIILAIALFGFKTMAIDDFFKAANIIGLWTVAVIALCGGSAYSVLWGAVIGILLGINDDIALSIAVYTIVAIGCGLGARYGKTAVCIGLGTISAIEAIWCREMGIMFFGYIDIPIAVLTVILTPDALLHPISRICGIKKDTSGEKQSKIFVKNRLNAAADSFRILAETFLDLSDKNKSAEIEDVAIMFDGTADKVCRECSRMSECWVTGFNNTYRSMFRMLEVMEKKGALYEDDVDEGFSKKCLRLRAVVREMNRMFEIYKINCVWKSKLCENRELAGQQLGSVAQILDSIAEDVEEEEIEKELEEEICSRMADRGVNVTEVNITVNTKGRYTALIRAYGKTEECRRAAEISIRSVLGIKMVAAGISDSADGGFAMRLTQPEGYRIEWGVARAIKSDESGDNCVLRYLSDGKFAAAISDGMGTGHRAARDSGATVKLLGDFLEAGFDKSVAVRLINSIMVMKSANEAFATVDMCIIDLYSGEAEFVKNGAEASYIKRGDITETVRAASLPVGIMRDMEIETFAHRVTAGDIIVMLSDGLQMKKGHEEWIKRMVEEADGNMPPQELAERIMGMAKTLKGGEVEDDMTAVVLKVIQIS